MMTALRSFLDSRFGPPVFAAAATLLTFGIVWVSVPADGYARILLFERSWIQPATTFAFWLSICLLSLKLERDVTERRSLEEAGKILDDPVLGITRSWKDAESIRARFVSQDLEPHQASVTFKRILTGLDRLRNTKSTASLEAYFRTRSDIDADELETSYTGIRYLIWLIPTLGFIGTVLGIGSGIGGFALAIENAESFAQVRDVLPTVTAQLGTAFDTTLLALALSAIAAFLMSYVSRREEGLLERIDTLSFDRVCSLFEEHSSESERMVSALEGQANKIRASMRDNRDLVESVIRDQLPGAIGQAVRQGLPADIVKLIGALVDEIGLVELVRRQAEALDEEEASPPKEEAREEEEEEEGTADDPDGSPPHA